MPYDWEQDDNPEWGDDGGEWRGLIYIAVAMLCMGLAMWILYAFAASYP